MHTISWKPLYVQSSNLSYVLAYYHGLLYYESIVYQSQSVIVRYTFQGVFTAFIASFIYYFIFVFYWDMWKLRHFKGPMPLPVVGNLYEKGAFEVCILQPRELSLIFLIPIFTLLVFHEDTKKKTINFVYLLAASSWYNLTFSFFFLITAWDAVYWMA